LFYYINQIINAGYYTSALVCWGLIFAAVPYLAASNHMTIPHPESITAALAISITGMVYLLAILIKLLIVKDLAEFRTLLTVIVFIAGASYLASMATISLFFGGVAAAKPIVYISIILFAVGISGFLKLAINFSKLAIAMFRHLRTRLSAHN
jgi:hypothetical protein